MSWSYPFSITAYGATDPLDAIELQQLLDYAKRKVNNIADGEIDGFGEVNDEGEFNVNYDASGGHDHDGTNSRLASVATDTEASGIAAHEGALKVEFVTDTIDVSTSRWSSDLLSGSTITNLKYFTIGYGKFHDNGNLPFTKIATEGPNDEYAWGIRGKTPYVGASPHRTEYYAVWDATNGELFVWADVGAVHNGGTAVDCDIYALLVGT